MRDEQAFRQAFLNNLESCQWEPHPLYSVFTQYDEEYYLSQKKIFLHKYRCFYAVSQTISPKVMIELGACAGSSGDAYLSATPDAKYIGIDNFGMNVRHDNQSPWDPYEIANCLFQSRGFKDYELIKADLRSLTTLPCSADFVVVDAAHDFDNEYADLKLALTANPVFIFVDDSEGEEAKAAIIQFLQKDVRERIDFTLDIEYTGGGKVIKLMA